MTILYIPLILWLTMGFFSAGYMCWYVQTAFPRLAPALWKQDLFLSVVLGGIGGPICFIVTIFFNINNKERFGLMYWPPNYHEKLKLMEILDEDSGIEYW
jgi:hypothetical protein